MPIKVDELKTRSGHPIVRATFIKEITVPEAQAYHRDLKPGAKYDGWGHLVLGNVTGVSSDVRKVLASQVPEDVTNPPPVAVVLESALARMAAGLAMRLSDNNNTDSFKNEQEALAWLDGRMTEFLRKRKK